MYAIVSDDCRFAVECPPTRQNGWNPCELTNAPGSNAYLGDRQEAEWMLGLARVQFPQLKFGIVEFT